jgi:hypothetical protein
MGSKWARQESSRVTEWAKGMTGEQMGSRGVHKNDRMGSRGGHRNGLRLRTERGKWEVAANQEGRNQTQEVRKRGTR